MNEQQNIVAFYRHKAMECHQHARSATEKKAATEAYAELSRELLRSLFSANQSERLIVHESLTKDDALFLSGVTLDCAVFSRRQNCHDEIGWGLIATMFNSFTLLGAELFDEFAALHHSAKKLGYDLEGYYRANRHLALPEMQEALDRYFARGGMDLSQTGWKEGTTKSGEFTYTFRRSHER